MSSLKSCTRDQRSPTLNLHIISAKGPSNLIPRMPPCSGMSQPDRPECLITVLPSICRGRTEEHQGTVCKGRLAKETARFGRLMLQGLWGIGPSRSPERELPLCSLTFQQLQLQAPLILCSTFDLPGNERARRVSKDCNGHQRDCSADSSLSESTWTYMAAAIEAPNIIDLQVLF